jgi:hypothetical protein
MIHRGRFDFDSVGELKHLNPSDQAAALGDASSDLISTAAPIRAAFGTLSGVIVTVTVQGSDREVVLLALLAILAHDIATLPDSQMRANALVIHDEVIRQLGIAHQDAEFALRNLNVLKHALAR